MLRGTIECLILQKILFVVLTHDCGLIVAQQYDEYFHHIVLLCMDNVTTTLLHPVFNNLDQLIIVDRL